MVGNRQQNQELDKRETKKMSETGPHVDGFRSLFSR